MCKRLSCRRYNAGRVFAYDGWDLVREWRTDGAGATNVLDYYWGLDLSGTLGGAGGIGGLLAVSVGGDFYLPLYDANGNVTAYIDESGNTVAQYTYDAFGNTISQSGALADAFPFRFSTRYFDEVTGFYYYGLRYYSPKLRRWISEDPAGENAGANLYAFCGNDSVNGVDPLGLTRVKINFEAKQMEDTVKMDDFLTVSVVVIEKPKKGNMLNFIQLKSDGISEWEVDKQGDVTSGRPYYYDNVLDTYKYKSVNPDGNQILSLYDRPGGQLSAVYFFTAVVEIERTCRLETIFKLRSCYDKVKVVASTSWRYNPRSSVKYSFGNTAYGKEVNPSMVSVIRQLSLGRKWSNLVCSSVTVESVQ